MIKQINKEYVTFSIYTCITKKISFAKFSEKKINTVD